MGKKIERVVSKQQERRRKILGAQFDIHHPYLAATGTLASPLCAGTPAHLSRQARDPEFDPTLPGLPPAPLPPRGTTLLLALPPTCAAPQGTVSCWIIRLDWQTWNSWVHAKERRREAPGKRQFRSAGKEPTPNLTSPKTRKRKTACHLKPKVLLTFLHYLDNSQNLLKHEKK